MKMKRRKFNPLKRLKNHNQAIYKVEIESLIVELAKTGTTSHNPVLDGFICGQQNGDNKVCRVSSSGQHSFTFAGLVYRALIARLRKVNLIHPVRTKPDDREGFVQHFR